MRKSTAPRGGTYGSNEAIRPERRAPDEVQVVKDLDPLQLTQYAIFDIDTVWLYFLEKERVETADRS